MPDPSASLILLPHRLDAGVTGVPATPGPRSARALHVLGKPLPLPRALPRTDFLWHSHWPTAAEGELPALQSLLPWARSGHR